MRKRRAGKFLVLLAAGFVLCFQAGLADALPPDQKHVYEGGINYFDVSACDTSGASSSQTVSNVYVLGDSITVRAASAYTKAFQQAGASTVNIDGSSSRSLTAPGTDGNKLSGFDAINHDQSEIQQANAIVVALGTNGGDTTANIDKAISALRADNPSAPIYWVDTFVLDRPTYNSGVIAPANQAIYSEAQSQNYQVISWFNAVDPNADPQHPSGNEADSNGYIDNSDGLGVHPTPAGSTALASLVAGAVTNPVNSAGASSPGSSTGGSDCACSTGSTVLTGSDNEDKVWNYFKGKGLSDAQVAGIMGNMEQESGFIPTDMEIGGRSKNPYDAGSEGWGLIQWSGNAGSGSTGDKVTSEYKQSGVQGPIYTLATQLDLVWQNMNNHPVVTQPFDLNHFKSITDPRDAATYFEAQIEGGTDPGGVRENNAVSILQQYGGTGGGSSDPTTGGGCASAASSPDCTSATGDAKILCDAKQYDPVDYVWGGGHGGGAAYQQACPTIQANNSACGLDCSGLVSVAVYDAFGNDKSWNTSGDGTNSIDSDPSNWKGAQFSQLQPGDVIEPNPGHVEIVDHVTGNTVYTFGAHTEKAQQPQQVGPGSYPNAAGNSSYKYFHYVGQGAS